jgi:hypothetical protein
MGVDVVWICWTCRTYHCPGWSDVLTGEIEEQINNGKDLVDFLRELATDIAQTFTEYHNDSARLVSFLDDLANWLEKHRGHRVYLTNDHNPNAPWEELEREV